MYRKPEIQLKIEEFVLPFGGKLNPENRWVKLSQIIPWEEIEKKYAQLFSSDLGTVAKPLRVALGALIIKENVVFPTVKPLSKSARTRICSFLLAMSVTRMIRFLLIRRSWFIFVSA